MSRPIHPVVVGTAGHIDHGKSSLVRALTGIDPDRLKEEKERGLTIDLGFARLKMSDGRYLGLIDVPGHERFIRNMVAGSTALDMAVLVVAADDGVMPQTREHLHILDLLGVRGGIVALTKIDIVDEEMVLLAEEEVRELLLGTVLEAAPILRVSSVTGEGLEELRAALEERAQDVEPRPSGGAFRMPIQRVFTLQGIGTVVTGVPLAGRVRPGEEVEFLPGGQRAKVRAVHAYGGKVEEAVAGHSTALSVPDAKEIGAHRGLVVAAPGFYGSGDAVDINLRLLQRAPEIEHRVPVRFHSGTSEIQGILLLLDRERARGGESLVVRVLLEEELCATHGDRCILRLQNPVVTMGGGQVLRLSTAHRRYRRQALGAELAGIREAGSRPQARIAHELGQAGATGVLVSELAATLGCNGEQALAVAAEMPEVWVYHGKGRVFDRKTFEVGVQELLDSVDRILRARKLAASIVRTNLRPSRTLPAELIDAVLDHLICAGRVRPGSQGRLLFRDRLQPLPEATRAMLDRVVAHCEELGWRPPTGEELVAGTGVPEGERDGLLARAVDEVLVDKVGDHYYGHGVMERTLAAIRDNCLAHDGLLDIPQLRDTLGTSRKFLIPLLEHVDSLGLTILRGGVRRLLVDSEINLRLAGGPDA